MLHDIEDSRRVNALLKEALGKEVGLVVMDCMILSSNYWPSLVQPGVCEALEAKETTALPAYLHPRLERLLQIFVHHYTTLKKPRLLQLLVETVPVVTPKDPEEEAVDPYADMDEEGEGVSHGVVLPGGSIGFVDLQLDFLDGVVRRFRCSPLQVLRSLPCHRPSQGIS